MQSLFETQLGDEDHLPRPRVVSQFDQNRISCGSLDCRSGGGLVGGFRL